MLRIIIDTREQLPLHFEPWDAETSIGTLRQGDYALHGDTQFAIERKSLEDFLGTISSGWERFLREIGRMDAHAFIAMPILIEGDFESVCFTEFEGRTVPPRHRHHNLSPKFICKRIAELTLLGCAPLFASNAGYASALALAMFRLRSEMIKSGGDPERARSRFIEFILNLPKE